MGKIIGIDLGTTNSVVAVMEGGEPVVITNSEGARTTPSVVAFSKSGEVLVGEVAKRQAITNPDRTFRSIKRHMGEDWKSADIDGKQYTPQEISAHILRELKRRFGRKLCLMGNLHTTDVMLRGSPQTVEAAARQAIDDAGDVGGFILSTGDQCGRDTPDENLRAMVEVARTYGEYRGGN